MAAKQTAKKPAKKQPSEQQTAQAATKQHTAVSAPSRKRYAVWILAGVAYTVVMVVLTAAIMQTNGWHHTSLGKNPNAANNVQSAPVPLSQNTTQVHACSDSIASIGSYTYSAKYFFDLKQAGYQLVDTLSQQASNGRDFTDADCTKYFAVRATHPAEHIMLQLFVRDKSGAPLPYQYKDLKSDTCYYDDTTSRTTCPNAPLYGIFVKD